MISVARAMTDSDSLVVSTVDRNSDMKFIWPEKVYFRGCTHRSIPLLDDAAFNERMLCQDDLTLLKFGLDFFMRSTPFLKSFWLTEFGLVMVTDALTEYAMRIWRAINRVHLGDTDAPTVAEITRHINHLSGRTMMIPSIYSGPKNGQYPILNKMHELFTLFATGKISILNHEILPEAALLHEQTHDLLDRLTRDLPLFLEYEDGPRSDPFTHVDRLGKLRARGEVVMYACVEPTPVPRSVDLWEHMSEMYAESCYWLLQRETPRNMIALMDFIHVKTGYSTTTNELMGYMRDRTSTIDILAFLFELTAGDFTWNFWALV
ncbi:ORF61 [Ictalurid herpesvirus 1]|uniref:Uncharacterized protein ORF61 n=1 Tax=Ictalurid herpesvirus 1 (strain Auburn) TaxID=766178 RepID=VG61_ICHVA|nr:ORF61 [Ictalurid herpesvirus 1]Q00122.1 RecName: Full=Uncharacterized protein ORF61 [Ictalurid herpesvirus 1 (strain Auburn)]AAA88164.1 ORF61 [Ictalurid herpesvirus 1]